MTRQQEEPRTLGNTTNLSPMAPGSNHVTNYSTTELVRLDIVPAITDHAALPNLPEEQISGVLRQGGKLVLTGGSKSGKSFLMIELGVAIATGTPWCGLPCKPGRVLIANLEIREEQFMHRVADVVEALNVNKNLVAQNLHVLNLRGKIQNIEQLAKSLSSQCACSDYSMVIIDPMYKVQIGAENEARSITEFCAQLDKITNELGASVAYCHHHSKGSQGWKASEDRASGSGVIARDADALIDMMTLQHEEAEADNCGIPFRLEFILRDFKEPDPVNIRFRFPIHKLDESGDLIGRSYAGTTKKRSSQQAAQKLAYVEEFCDSLMGSRSEMPRSELSKALNKDKRTITRILEKSERFEVQSDNSSSTVYRIEQ